MSEARSATSNDDPLTLGTQLCFAVYSASHAFNSVYKPLLERIGLTYPQYIVMLALWESNGQTVGSLGDRLKLESNTLTPLLKRLEAAGLVERRRDPADERRVIVSLTEAGRAKRGEAGDIPACVLSATGMTLGDLEALRDQITTLRDTLEKSGGV